MIVITDSHSNSVSFNHNSSLIMSVRGLQLVLDVILKENGQPKFCSFLGVGLHCHQPKSLELLLAIATNSLLYHGLSSNHGSL